MKTKNIILTSTLILILILIIYQIGVITAICPDTGVKEVSSIIVEEIFAEEVETKFDYDEYFEAIYTDYCCLPQEEDIEALANTIYGEAGGIKSDMHRAAVAWCVLNRYDAEKYGRTILEIVSKPKQYTGYNAKRVYKTQAQKDLYEHCRWLAKDVLTRWYMEKDGFENVGRTLPSDYLYFYGDGKYNHFRNEFKSKNYWNWTLENPYQN